MSEWQPIETAPRDGTLILTFDAEQESQCLVSHWKDSLDYWEPGTWRDDGGTPSHWMPLPEPPETAMKPREGDGRLGKTVTSKDLS